MKRYETLKDLIADRATEALRATRSQPAFGIALSEVRFLPPLPNADKIICVGMNYRKPYPIAGITPPDPSNIILFGKEHTAMLGHLEKLEIPAGKAAQSFDYEGEIAVVIGKAGRHIPETTASEHILGYSLFNDGSVREWQKHSIYAGKNFAGSGSWGP